MKTKQTLLIALIFFFGFLSFSFANDKKALVHQETQTVDPVKKASKSVVGIWDPQVQRASLSGVYGSLKGPISIKAAGVVLKSENGSVVVITTYLPEKPVTLEFAEDRSYYNLPIESLIKSRVVTGKDIVNLGNGLVTLSKGKTGNVPVPKWVNQVEIEKQPLGAEVCQAFMIINYLGNPELAIWGKVQNGLFYEKTGLSKSFGVPGSPIFDKFGRLIGLLDKNSRVIHVAW